MHERILELTSVGKSFGPNRVLDRVNFDLHAGEVHILAGENGAGKSTLIKILAGVHTEYDGAVRLFGETVKFAGPQEANRRGISVIHQELSLVDSMSVADNIHLGREPARCLGLWVDRRRHLDRALELCRRLSLDFSAEDLSRPVGQFSMSVKNRIEIAKALAFEARIIVMDEPTSALNQAEAGKLFEVMEGLKRSGCGIIYISHRMEEIYRLGDRITVLRDGRWVGTDSAADCPEPELIKRMIGRELSAWIPGRRPPQGPRESTPRLEVLDWSVGSPVASRPDLVQDFSVSVRPGEIVGFAGLQGSGTSELIQSLFGAGSGSCRGRLSIDGREFWPSDPRRSVRRGLAYLPADRKTSGLVLAMSVMENISLAALPRLSARGILRPRSERLRAQHHVDALGIRTSSLDQAVATLSGGNQQKVVLAKWLETNPKVLLLEEPTRGVDIGAKREIYSLINDWSAAGVAILLVSTELQELIGLCDRILVFHRGRMTGEFDRDSSDPGRILAAAMGADSRDAPRQVPESGGPFGAAPFAGYAAA